MLLQALWELTKVLGILSAHFSLLLPLSGLRLQFLPLLLEATSVADSHGAQVYGDMLMKALCGVFRVRQVR